MTPQAHWYLNGPWPIETGEPKAIQELIELGYAKESRHFLTYKKNYILTETGRIERANRNKISSS